MTLLITATLLSLSLFIGIYRLLLGPKVLHRILAFDLICICIIALMSLFSLINDYHHFLEITLIFCLLGFITTIAFMDNLFRGKVDHE